MIDRLTAYVAGPYTHGDTKENARRASAVWQFLESSGLWAFVSHGYTAHLHDLKPLPYETWMRWDLDLIRIVKPRLIVRLPGLSPGSDREIALATKLGASAWLMSESDVGGCLQLLRRRVEDDLRLARPEGRPE